MMIDYHKSVYKLLKYSLIPLAKVKFFLNLKRYFFVISKINLKREIIFKHSKLLHIFLDELPIYDLPEFIKICES